MQESPDFPFDELINLAIITTNRVLDENYPILLVTHDANDGGWQFLCGTTNDPDDAKVIGLGRIYKLDSSIAELADLPLGWRAWRKYKDSPWHRQLNS